MIFRQENRKYICCNDFDRSKQILFNLYIKHNVGSVIPTIMSRTFRQVFNFGTRDKTHYFPGHMLKGLRQMQSTLKHVDAIVEVHDARIPFSGRNPKFDETINLRPHMLALNKMDLTDNSQQEAVIDRLKEDGVGDVLYTNCIKNNHPSLRRDFIPKVLDLVHSAPRFHRTHTDSFNLLVIGVPNVGKSSFINALRSIHLKKGKATRTGGEAGITRSVENKIKVHESPDIYIIDTPGILSPNIESMEVGMKLASCATIKDHIVGEELIADYILFWLNKNGYFDYTDYFNLPDSYDSVYELLIEICKRHDMFSKRRVMTGTGTQYAMRPDVKRAATAFVRAFRSGKLGKVNLDEDMIVDGNIEQL